MQAAPGSTRASRRSAATPCGWGSSRRRRAPTRCTGTRCRWIPTRRKAPSPLRLAENNLFDPLIDARVLYFAATLLVAGVVFFVVFIAAPAWRDAAGGDVAVAVRARLAWLAW